MLEPKGLMPHSLPCDAKEIIWTRPKRLFGTKVEHGLTPDTNQSGTCRNCVLRPVKVVILIQLG